MRRGLDSTLLASLGLMFREDSLLFWAYTVGLTGWVFFKYSVVDCRNVIIEKLSCLAQTISYFWCFCLTCWEDDAIENLITAVLD